MDSQNNILKIRDRIDTIDETILSLLQERFDCAKEIGRHKNDANKDTWDPQRELEIYKRLLEKNNSVFPENALRSIFHEVISTCRLAQGKAAVAYLGPEATYTHQAGVKYFGQSAEYRPIESIIEVFQEVEKGRVQYGIVPVENSIEGAVTSCLDSFSNYNVKICGEIQLPISHSLVCQSGRMTDIKTVASHEQPLAQCRNWLRKNLPDTPTLPVFSTGGAAMMAAKDPSIGAIASDLAVTTYNLQVVVKGVEDCTGNTTRFLVLGKKSPKKSGNDKTSIMLGLINRPGALNEILTIMSARQIDLAKIESRPSRGKQWKYVFFLDLVGHMDDPVIQESCDILKQICAYFDWLGSYPRADNVEVRGV